MASAAPSARTVVIDPTIRDYVLMPILFPLNSATPSSDEAAYLMNVVHAMTDYPDMVIDVEGNAARTEHEPPALSERRAAVVVQRLVELGVDRRRLRSHAFAAYCPLQSGSGWQKDARVDFRIVATKGGPDLAAVGCDAARRAGLLPPDSGARP